MSQQNLTVEQRYAQLKEKFSEIDKEYNRTLNEIDLDFPESLGLTKLTFTPSDQQELEQLAGAYYQGLYGQKLAEKTQLILQKQSGKNLKILQQLDKHNQQCQTLLNKYNKKRLAFIEKALKNCITESTIYQQELQRLQQEYDLQVNSCKTSHNQAVQALNEQIQLLEQLLAQVTEHIQQQKQGKSDEKLLALQQKEQKQSDSVTKYNNTVDKLEADYKVKIEKAYATVIAAEQRRALEVLNLLATLGVSGVDRLKAEEKVAIAQQFFDTLTRSVAQSLFNGDLSLEYHFGTYYNYMKDYVNNLPE